jgi:hypothetical protein
MTQDVVTEFLNEDYQFVREFTAYMPRNGRVYDIQDAFFIPFTGFSGVERPGPNFTLYRRSSANLKNAGRTGP